MSKMSKLRPSPALVVSFVALIAVVGGTAVAAPNSTLQSVNKAKVKTIAKNQANKAIRARAPGLSVLSAKTAAPIGPAGGDLTGEYPNPKIADNAVTTAKIAANAVTTAKIADNAVTTAKIADNAVTGPKIAEDAVKARELGPTQVVTNGAGIAANTTATVAVACPTGTQLISGGGTVTNAGVFMTRSFPSGTAWAVTYQNTTATAGTITAFASCL